MEKKSLYFVSPEGPMSRAKVKTFVLDTNVLLHDPQSIFKFEDNNLAVTGRLNTSTTQRDVTFVTVEDNENTSFSTPRYILSKMFLIKKYIIIQHLL